MNILVTGANGQLGLKLQELLKKENRLTLTDIGSMDITDKKEVDRVIKFKKPEFVIHTAAYTRVDDAEKNIKLCEKINILGTKNIVRATRDIGATLIYISTDYIFDGKRKFRDKRQFGHVFDGKKNKPYTEKDKPKPLSVYGKTKLKGEELIQDIYDKFYIIRTSWIFGELPKGYAGTNFVETMLRLAKEKKSLNIVNDQIGSPTYTKDLVEIIDKIIKFKVPYGIYNFSGEGECSWYDFAKEIFRQRKINININPIKTSEYPQKTKRPAYSYLDKTKIEKTLGIKVRPWSEMLKEYLRNKNN